MVFKEKADETLLVPALVQPRASKTDLRGRTAHENSTRCRKDMHCASCSKGGPGIPENSTRCRKDTQCANCVSPPLTALTSADGRVAPRAALSRKLGNTVDHAVQMCKYETPTCGFPESAHALPRARPVPP